MKRLLKWIVSLLPKRYIVFESLPDLADNTKAVFDEMLRRGLNKKYRFIWYVNDKNVWDRRYPNTSYIDMKTPWHRIQYHWYRVCAKCFICCNRFLSSEKKQSSFYLTHGTAIKSVRNYYNVPSSIDYLITAAEGTNEMMAYELNFDIKRIRALGFPRNDVLTDYRTDIKPLFAGDFQKIIVWYPTFRQHHNGFKTATSGALPILENLAQAEEVNAFAKERDVLLVIKPHFAQDVSYIKNYNLSNIQFIDDDFYKEHKLTSYQFIGNCDALITDYSSVYFDYLLCDKPIAVVWSDIEEYKRNPGFAIPLEHYLKGAEKIYTAEDFKLFIDDLARGEDRLKNERAEICKWANCARDGKNAERVTDFIISAAGL